MLKTITAILALIVIAIICQSFFSTEEKNVTDPEANYVNYCGGCHGEKMDAFVDRKWKHGSSKDSLFAAIKIGIVNEGMPGFDTTFTDEETRELVDYIITGIKNVNRFTFKEAPKSNIFPSESITVKLDTIISGMNVPWGIAFLPNGDLLVTERDGKLYQVDKRHRKTLISGVPEVVAEGQGGLMDIVLHPNFKKNHLLYLSYSLGKQTSDGKLATTVVMRAELKDGSLINQQRIFEALPYSKTRHHYGSRLLFDKQGYLFITVGERGNEKENPQDLKRSLGKVHRIHDDGRIPADNPFVNTQGAVASIFTYGHRNPQGMALNPATNEVWTHEHGPRGGDEINILKKGKNYGWPVTSYGINYNGTILTSKSSMEGIEDPLLYYLPSIAPSGMAFVQGNRYKGWKGQLLVGSLRFKYLELCKIADNKVVKQEMLLKNIGRVRDVRMGPDGYIYVAVEKPGAVFRLIPVK